MTPILVNDLITEVRNQIDEANTSDITDEKIRKALNRAARNCYHIISKVYDQLMLTSEAFTAASTGIIPTPKNIFSNRVEFVTITIAGVKTKLQKIPPNKKHLYETPLISGMPIAYTVIGSNIYLLPAGAYSGDIFFMRKPQSLQLSQGKVVALTSTTISVDTIGSLLTTNIENLTGFASIIDKFTGENKGVFQIEAISGNDISVKATPDRTSVLGFTVASDISLAELDDYIAPIGTTCILELINDHADYLVQYSVVEIKRSLSLPVDADFAALKDLEDHVNAIWSGRENDRTITHRNSHWNFRYGK